MTASPKYAPRPLLANITQEADSRHNIEAHAHQQQHAKPTPGMKDVSYFQRQYATAFMAESIRSHQEYLAAQPSQQGGEEAPLPPQQQQPVTGPSRSMRAPRRASLPAQPQQRRGPMHDDVDGYPCSCPDCNVRRLQEVMEESQHEPGYGSIPQSPVVAGEPTSPCYDASPYHQVRPQAFDFYGNPIPQQQAPARRPSPPTRTRQHSPYTMPVVVGYSPDSGFHGRAPTSPLYPTYNPQQQQQPPQQQQQQQQQMYGYTPMEMSAPHMPMPYQHQPSFDVPYIPATHDYARYAQLDDDSEVAAAARDAEPHTPARTQRAGRNAAPRVAASERRARLSPLSSDVVEAPVTAHEQEVATPSGKAKPSSRRGQPAGDETASPRSNTGRRSSPTPVAAARPLCPFVLKVRTSKWHVRLVASPAAYEEGAHVLIEGDRGRDAGKVISCSKATDDGRQHPMALVAATPAEVDTIAQNEADAELTITNAVIAARKLKLPMQIVGAVYQHDRAKLTFMYEATERVDFRQLLRDLYSEYRCRIWMEIPPGSPNPLARSTSPVQ